MKKVFDTISDSHYARGMSVAHRVNIYEGTRLMTWTEDAEFKVAWRAAVSAVKVLGLDTGCTERSLEASAGNARFTCGNFAAIPARRVRGRERIPGLRIGLIA